MTRLPATETILNTPLPCKKDFVREAGKSAINKSIETLQAQRKTGELVCLLDCSSLCRLGEKDQAFSGSTPRFRSTKNI